MKDEPAKFKRLEASFSKAPESFRARKAIAKSRTLQLQSCFIHIRAWKVSGTFPGGNFTDPKPYFKI